MILGSFPDWPTKKPASLRWVLEPSRWTRMSSDAVPPMVQVGRVPVASCTAAWTVNSPAVQFRLPRPRSPAQLAFCRAALVPIGWAATGSAQNSADTRNAESTRRPLRARVRMRACERPAPVAWMDPSFKCISVSLVDGRKTRRKPTPWFHQAWAYHPVYRYCLGCLNSTPTIPSAESVCQATHFSSPGWRWPTAIPEPVHHS